MHWKNLELCLEWVNFTYVYFEFDYKFSKFLAVLFTFFSLIFKYKS